jgi:hypothetical protein
MAAAGSSPSRGGGSLPGGAARFRGGSLAAWSEVRRRARHRNVGTGVACPRWRRPSCRGCELQARFFPSGPGRAYGAGLVAVGKRGGAWWRWSRGTVVVSAAGQAGTGWMLELCPRGNNKDVIIIILVHDNVYIPC